MSKTSGNQTWQLDMHCEKIEVLLFKSPRKMVELSCLPRLITRGQQRGIGVSH